jgi:hypothetical protein
MAITLIIDNTVYDKKILLSINLPIFCFVLIYLIIKKYHTNYIKHNNIIFIIIILLIIARFIYIHVENSKNLSESEYTKVNKDDIYIYINLIYYLVFLLIAIILFKNNLIFLIIFILIFIINIFFIFYNYNIHNNFSYNYEGFFGINYNSKIDNITIIIYLITLIISIILLIKKNILDNDDDNINLIFIIIFVFIILLFLFGLILKFYKNVLFGIDFTTNSIDYKQILYINDTEFNANEKDNIMEKYLSIHKNKYKILNFNLINGKEYEIIFSESDTITNDRIETINKKYKEDNIKDLYLISKNELSDNENEKLLNYENLLLNNYNKLTCDNFLISYYDKYKLDNYDEFESNFIKFDNILNNNKYYYITIFIIILSIIILSILYFKLKRKIK